MSIRPDIREAVVNAIAPAVAPVLVIGGRIYPDQAEALPRIIVQSPPHERKRAIVKGPPSYETRAIFPVTLRVNGKTYSAADDALEALISKVEVAIFSWLPFQQLVEYVVSVETRRTVAAEGAFHVGEAVMLFEMEYCEFFDPAPGAAIIEFQGSITDPTTEIEIGSFQVKTV